MSLGPVSYDSWRTTDPADRELGNVGDPVRPHPRIPQERCCVCGDLASKGQLCSFHYIEGRTCGIRGEMEE